MRCRLQLQGSVGCTSAEQRELLDGGSGGSCAEEHPEKLEHEWLGLGGLLVAVTRTEPKEPRIGEEEADTLVTSISPTR